MNRTHTEDEVRFGAYDALSRSLSVDDIGVGHGAFTSTHDGVARTGRSVVVQYVQLLWCRGGKLRRSGGGLSASASLARWMLDERYDATGHEPGRSYGLARAGYLDDFDDAPTGRDFDAATRARSNDLVGARTVVGGDDNLHAIALHVLSVARLDRARAVVLLHMPRPLDLGTTHQIRTEIRTSTEDEGRSWSYARRHNATWKLCREPFVPRARSDEQANAKKLAAEDGTGQ